MAKLKPRMSEAPGPALPDDSQGLGKTMPPSDGGPRDPRHVLNPRRTRLEPAMTYLLMVGEYADARLPGWVETLQRGQFGGPIPEAVWTIHKSALIAEAARHNFEPYQLTEKRPTGAGFEQWKAEFLDRHRY